MELVWLQDFVALTQHGGFSRAASARNVSQPAFSRRIRALEEWLGAELVDRGTHQIVLTPAGKRFATIAETILREIEQGRREVQEIAGTSASTIRIMVTHALALHFFPQWLAALQSKSDQALLVQMTADNLEASEKAMLGGQAHFCLCHHHPMAPTALDNGAFKSVSLGTDTLVAVSAPDASGQAPLHTIGDDNEGAVDFLAYDTKSGMGRIASAMIELNGASAVFRPVFTSHTLVLARMAKDGKGLAWLPLSIVAGDLEQGALIRVGGSRWDIPVNVRLYRPRARQSHSAEAFWKLAAS